jgi:hypothetical protein
VLVLRVLYVLFKSPFRRAERPIYVEQTEQIPGAVPAAV